MNLLIAGSAKANPATVLPIFDLAMALRSTSVLPLGGFQTPLEQDCLDILLKGDQHITICPARSVASVKTIYKGRLWQAVKRGVAEGRVKLESPFPDTITRATMKSAIIRNTWMVEQADAVLILHATPGGETERMARLAVELGKPLATLDHPANQHLIDLGAYPTSASDPLLAHPDRWPVPGRS